MQAIQSHLHSPRQANLIKNEAVIGIYSYAIVDHNCSFLNEGCESGFSIWWLFNGALFLYFMCCVTEGSRCTCPLG